MTVAPDVYRRAVRSRTTPIPTRNTSATLYLRPRPMGSPLTLLGVGLVLSILPAALSTREQHTRWRVTWYLSTDDFITLGLAGTAMLAGILLARGHRSTAPRSLQIDVAGLSKAVNVLLLLWVVAYATWTVSGIRHGMSLQLGLDALAGRSGATTAVKHVMVTVPGVSTLTEVAPVLAAALTVLWLAGERRSFACVLVLAVTALRAFLLSERLSLIAIAMPMVLVLALLAASADPADERRRIRRMRIALFSAPIGIVGFFALTERSRSWNSYYVNTWDGSLLGFSADRIWAYYATATNNGAIYSQYQAPTQRWPELSLQALTEAPLVGAVLRWFSVGGQTPKPWEKTLEAYANPELNNPSGLLPIVGELGLVAFIVFAVCGYVVGRLYWSARTGNPAAICGYAALAVGLVELSRYPFYTSVRVVPMALATAIVYLHVRRNRHEEWSE